MTTQARTQSAESSHYYYPTGEACYEVPRATGSGTRKTTLADARKMNLLPSVTTILKVLHKQALVDWLCEQTALAVLTTPRNEGEALDAFVERVLHTERVQDQESQKARDRGTEIHAAMEDLFCGKSISSELDPWVIPAFTELCGYGKLVTTEKILVGEGYAGKTDLIQESVNGWWIWDFKTTKKLPTKDSWTEHKMQTAFYAGAYSAMLSKQSMAGVLHHIQTGNVYISTVEPGKFAIFTQTDWHETLIRACIPALQLWQFLNNYTPTL